MDVLFTLLKSVRERGRVGAWCLSWWQRDPVGTAWSNQVAPQPGQAPGPLIHSTPPLVPTGPWDAGTSMDMITRFGRQHSYGYVLKTSFVKTEEMTLQWKRFVNASTVRRFSVLMVQLKGQHRLLRMTAHAL